MPDPELAAGAPPASTLRRGTDREAVDRRFLRRHRAVFDRVEPLVQGFDDPDRRGRFVQRLLGRITFIAFLQAGGWLRCRDGIGYLSALWESYTVGARPSSNFYRDRFRPLLAALFGGTGSADMLPRGRRDGSIEAAVGSVALLAPGLLEEEEDEDNPIVVVPDEAMAVVLRDLLEGFRFTPVEGAGPGAETALDPQAMAGAFETHAADRRERGRYYTPGSIVSFLCRETLKLYLESALPRESQRAVARLVERRDAGEIRVPEAAEEALRRVRICDPACGSGAFLLGMLRELVEIRASLPSDSSDPCSPRRSRLEILLGNLQGVELDPVAAEIARLRMWLYLAAPFERDRPPPLLDLRKAVEVADALTAPLPEGGFDVLVMNPPYLSANRLPGARRDAFLGYARRLREEQGFAADLYVHFFYRALRLLRVDGALGAITSGTFFTGHRGEPLRRELLRHRLRLLMPLGAGAFDATVYPAVTLLQKGRGDDPDHEILFSRPAGGEGQPGAPGVPFVGALRSGGLPIPAAEYRRAFGALFFEPTPENRRLFGTLLSSSGVVEVAGRRFAPLEIVAPVLDTGIDTGNVRHRLFHREAVPDLPLFRLLQGTQVVRYGVWWENPRARYRYADVEYTPDRGRKGTGRGGKPSARPEYWGFRGPRENHHVAERLLMRQTADEPFVGYLHQGSERVYTDNTLHTLLLTDRGRGLGISYRYLLAVLNSASLRRLYRAVAQEEGRTLPQVKTTIANRLPIPIPSGPEADQLETLVVGIQALHRQHGFPLSEAAPGLIAAAQTEIDRIVAGLYLSADIDHEKR